MIIWYETWKVWQNRQGVRIFEILKRFQEGTEKWEVALHHQKIPWKSTPLLVLKQLLLGRPRKNSKLAPRYKFGQFHNFPESWLTCLLSFCIDPHGPQYLQLLKGSETFRKVTLDWSTSKSNTILAKFCSKFETLFTIKCQFTSWISVKTVREGGTRWFPLSDEISPACTLSPLSSGQKLQKKRMHSFLNVTSALIVGTIFSSH